MKHTSVRKHPAKLFRPTPLIAALACALGAQVALAATFTVANNLDSGTGSLRQAITDANIACATAPHTITFTGAFTISPSTPLPAITCANPIQVGPGPGVAISGLNISYGSPCGLTANATNTRIEGLEVRNFSYGGGYGLCGTLTAVGNNLHQNVKGLYLTGASIVTNNNIHDNDYGIYAPSVGATITDNTITDNGSGILAGAGSSIKGNTISGHLNVEGKAILLHDGGVIGGPGAERNKLFNNFSNIYAYSSTAYGGPLTIENNLVGTDGTSVSLDPHGIEIQQHPTVTVRDNVIVGIRNSGLSINSVGTTGTVSGNKIGLNEAGTISQGNAIGLYLYNFQGGALTIHDNTISGNETYGLQIHNSNNITLTSNRIGTDLSGANARSNSLYGVHAFCSDSLSFSGNTVSGNGSSGMYLAGVSNSQFTENFVGSTTGGAAGVPNAGAGIWLDGNSCFPIPPQVSGTDLSPKVAKSAPYNNLLKSNTIAFNGGDGIFVFNSNGNVVTGETSSIHSNGGKSINLDYSYGARPNDPDSAGGTDRPNNRQNHPDIVSAEEDSGSTVIHYTLNSNPSTSFDLDFYANDTPQTAGKAGGKTHLRTVTVTTDATGNITNGLASFPGSRSHVTVTATGLYGTSEFADAIVPLVPAVSVTPSPNLNFGNVVVPGTSASQTVTLTSSGTGAYQIDSLSMTPLSCPGSGNTICSTGDFSCTATANCTPGTPMANGASCAITASFHPAAVGPSTTSIYICDNTSAAHRTITLSGHGTPMTLGVSPPSHDFGGVHLGTTALSPSITLSNTTSSTASLGTPVGGGPFTVSSTTCTATLAPGASCNVVMAYAPTAAALQSGNLTVPIGNPGASPVIVPLQGTGTVPYTIAPTSWDFGTQALGSTTATKVFTLSNASPNDVPLGAPVATAQFNVVSTTCASKIPATGTCTVTAGFTPTANGAATGQLSVPVALSGAPPMVAALQGFGGQATVMLPGQLDLGTALVGAPDMTAAFTLQNGGAVALAISSIAVTPPFAVSHSCPASLAPGASCAGVVKLTPTTAGNFTGTLSVASDAQGSPHTVALTAVVQSQQGVLSLPTGIDLGVAPLAGNTLTQSVQIKNTGNGNVDFTGINATAPFALAHNCPASLAPNASCVANLSFAPLIYGNTTGQLTVGSNAAGGDRVITLLATVSGVQYGISPGDWSFGSVPVGTRSTPAKSFTISNNGDTAVPLSGVTVTGPFSIAANTCGTSLGPRSACTADVVFDPVQAGLATGTVKALVGLTGAPPAQATLSGTGTQAAGLGLPTTVDFGSITLGSVPTATQTVELRNTGNAVLTFGISVSGPFLLSGTCGLNLSPGGACNLVLTFTPAAVGEFTGNLSIVSNAPGGSRSIALIARVQAAPRPELRVDMRFMGYGDQMLGTLSGTQRVILSNVGGSAAALGIGLPLPHYIASTQCGATLAPGATCVTDVRFRPLATGPRAAQLVFTGDATGIPLVVDLLGRGCSPPRPGRPASCN